MSDRQLCSPCGAGGIVRGRCAALASCAILFLHLCMRDRTARESAARGWRRQAGRRAGPPMRMRQQGKIWALRDVPPYRVALSADAWACWCCSLAFVPISDRGNLWVYSRAARLLSIQPHIVAGPLAANADEGFRLQSLPSFRVVGKPAPFATVGESTAGVLAPRGTPRRRVHAPAGADARRRGGVDCSGTRFCPRARRLGQTGWNAHGYAD